MGKDGRTAYERRLGRTLEIAVVPFGETVWYKKIKKNKYEAHKRGDAVGRGSVAGTQPWVQRTAYWNGSGDSEGVHIDSEE